VRDEMPRLPQSRRNHVAITSQSRREHVAITPHHAPAFHPNGPACLVNDELAGNPPSVPAITPRVPG
jgi:hypothetical protein